jgi:ribosomal protein S18 acetylase RimI-like enzyme
MENFDIRLARHGEEKTICSLLYKSFVGYKSLYTERAFKATTLTAGKIRERIDHKLIWVGLYSNVIIATLSLQPLNDAMYIRSVAVLPTARRKGLARELMMHAEGEAVKKNLLLLELTTTSFLVEAIKLYKTCGFEACGYEDLYGTRLITMKKKLKPTIVLAGNRIITLNG